MIKKLDTHHQEIIGFRLTGELKEKAFKEMTDRLAHSLTEKEKVNIYLEISAYEKMEPEIIWESLKFAFEHLREYLNKVEKIAVVSNNQFLLKATQIEDKLIPQIKEKAFHLKEKDKALDWLKNTNDRD